MALVHSIRARLALWHALTLATLLVAFAAGVWLFVGRTLRARADGAMADMSAELEKSWREDIAEEAAAPLEALRAGIVEYRNRDARLLVYDSSATLVAISDSTPLSPGLTVAHLATRGRGPLAALMSSTRAGAAYTTLPGTTRTAPAVRAQARRLSVGAAAYTMVTLRSLAPEEGTMRSFARALALAIPLAILVAFIGGYLLARASLAPVVSMGQQAERIGSTNLNERLPVADPRDELGALARVMNNLLARLEKSFRGQQRSIEQQRQFMADASHELRTPVAALRTTADVALARPDTDAAELREALDVVRGEGRRLTRIVDDLFLLARADSGQLTPRAERVFLDDIVQDSARAVRALAETRGVTVSVGQVDETPVVGDRELLRRAVMILVDNAIKYTPRGGSVRMGVRSDGEGAPAIVVEDSGPGVPEGERDHIFERFVRLDAARTRGENGAGGAGLGLAIARWIAEAHGGSARLERSGPGGSRFVLVFARQ